MRRDLPIVAKYLLVVAAVIALMFVIAQNDAVATGPSVVHAYSSPGSFAVEAHDTTWRDNTRERDVPVRIYSPINKNHLAVVARRFPVILYSHGLGGSRDGGKQWAEHWTSYGYVVVSIQHPGSDEGLWKNRAIGERATSMKSAMSLTNLGLRVGDVHFVIDEVIRRTEAGEAEFAEADSKRIGMAGHSFGAQTTLAVGGQKAGNLGGQSGLDVRIVSAVALSPNARNKINLARQFGDIRIPLFSITGTEDGSILGDATRYQDRMLPYENMPAGGKYLAVFEGGDHKVFGGNEAAQRRAATVRDNVIQANVRAATLAFWNATLKNDDSARQWLDAGGFRSVLDAKDVYVSK